MTLAKQYHLKLLLNMALIRFARILLILDYTQEAVTLLRRILPDILTNGDIMSQGYAQFLYAQGLMTLLPRDKWQQVERSLIDARKCILSLC
jgi:hypothetical protein